MLDAKYIDVNNIKDGAGIFPIDFVLLADEMCELQGRVNNLHSH